MTTSPRDLPVAILAGGRGTRLLPLTARLPKLLVPVGGAPFLDHQLRLLRQSGVRRVVLCLGHLGAEVEARYGDGSAHGVELLHSHDGAQPLGTGGALRAALPLLGEAFLVLYGDSYLEVDYAAVGRWWQAGGRAGLMTVCEAAAAGVAPNAWLEAGLVRRYGKNSPEPRMRHVDYGLGAFRADVFAGWPPGAAFDLAAVQADLADRGQLAGWEAPGRFFEIGSPAGLSELEDHLARTRCSP